MQAAVAATQTAQSAEGPAPKPTHTPVSPTDTPMPKPPTDTSVPEPAAGQPSPPALSHIARVWANEGGDKVTRDELRATKDPDTVLNSVWNGTSISLFGARNEVVAFNLVLEAPTTDATDVDVTLTELTGPDSTAITTRPASGDDLTCSITPNGRKGRPWLWRESNGK